MMKAILSSILLLCLLGSALTAQNGPDQTGPPGECTAGQVDNQAHDPSQYTPVLYHFAPSATRAPQSTNSLKFMSFNIQSDYDLYCAESLSNQTALMASVYPHFLGIQETDIGVDIRCNCNMPQAVADATGYETTFMQMFPWRTGKYGTTAASGYPVEQYVYKYYNLVGAWQGSENFEQRGALAHLVSPPQLNGVQKMWFINTHLEQSSLDARKIQVAQLINFTQNTLLAMEPNAVVVITGDFYTVPGDGSYEAMRTYFQNAWETFNGSPNGGFTHPSDYATLRFDHIWYRDSAAGNLAVHVDDFTIVKSLLSDHNPIHATLSFAGAAGSNPTPAPSNPTPAPANPTPAPSNPTDAPSSSSGSASNPTPVPATAAPTSVPATPAPTAAPTAAPSGSGKPNGGTGNAGSQSDDSHDSDFWKILYSGYTDNSCSNLESNVTGQIFAYKCASENRLTKQSGKIIYVDDVYLISCDYDDANCVDQTVCATYNNSQCYASDTVQFSNKYSWTKDEWGRYTITYSSYGDQTCTAGNNDLVGQIFLGTCATEYRSKSQSGMITYIDATMLTSCDYSDGNCQDAVVCVNYTNSNCNSYTGAPAYSDRYTWAHQIPSSSAALAASAVLVASTLALAFL